MASTKIINVLRGDTFDELLEIFQNNEAREVIFVLPKKGKFLENEEQFAQLASVSGELGRSVSILCANPYTNQLARKHGFNVLDQKSEAPSKPAQVTLTRAAVPPQDPEIIDDSNDAFTDDVVIPSDERMGISDGSDEEEGEKSGMHIIEPDEDDSDLEDKPDKDKDEEDIDDEDEGESAIEEFYRDAHDPTANFTVAAVGKNPQFETQTAAKVRNIEDVIRPIQREEHSLRVAQKKEKVAKVDISRSPRTAEDRVLESVWRDAEAEEKQNESRWSKLSHLGRKLGAAAPRRSSRTIPRKYIGIGLGIAVVLGATVLLYPEKAVIALIPLKQSLNFETKIEIGDSVGSVDPAFGKIPGQLFTLDHTATQDFQATGQKEVAQKARGKITVYNEYGTTPQTLISTTRFESPDGLIFRTLKTIIVPGTKVENGKITPGSIEVEVIADKPGTTYNITPTKFTIPAFKEKGDNDRYTKFYGQSTQAFSQGASGLAKVVTEADYTKAKDIVTTKLKSEMLDMLKAQSSDLEMFGSTDVIVKGTTSTAETDQAADVFTFSATGTIRAVGYKKSDLFDFIKQYVKRNQGLVVLPEKLEEYSLAPTSISADKAGISTTLKVRGPGYPEIDLAKVKSDLKGKTGDELRIYLKNLPSITKANVNIQSLWRDRVPTDESKIELSVDYGD